MGVTCNIEQVLMMQAMVLEQVNGVMGSDSFKLDIEGYADYSPATILAGSVGDINPQMNVDFDATMAGNTIVSICH